MEWIGFVFLFLSILLFPIGMLYIHVASIRQGLMKRDGAHWRIGIVKHCLQVSRNDSQRIFDIADIGSFRYAFNGNWTESSVVENALSVFDRQGRLLIKVPASAEGFDTVCTSLEAMDINFERVEVEAMAFLD